MALDDGGERTEQPTARRLEEAREEGRIARSADLNAAIVLLGGLVLFKIFGSDLLDSLLRLVLAIGGAGALSGADLTNHTLQLGRLAAQALAPLLILLMVVALVGTALQSGVPISFTRLRPRLDHLNPLNGIRRLCSLESVVRLGMGLLKMAAVGLVAYVTLSGQVDALLGLGLLEPLAALGAAGDLLYRLTLRMGVALLILALLDYLYQRWNWWRRLKMTKQEVRDELKRMDGDPHIKSRRRQLQLKLALQRIHLDVPKADVVVTNPTEFAVALKYDEAEMAAPRVVAKGKDFLALRIRQVAAQHGVPIVERPPLARALYAAVEVGQDVPPAFYRAVAEVLAYVYRLTGKAARRSAG